MRKLPALAALAALTLASPAAFAGPGRGGPGGPGARDDRREEKDPAKMREHREKMLRRVHTQFVIELGDLLGLDTAGTIKLSERLQKYSDQRVQLRLDSFDAMQQLKALARGQGSGDAAALAKRAAANRVKLAEIDQKELDDVLQGLPADKAAKVALFAAHFGKRIEHMAHMARGGRGGPGGPGGRGGPGGPGWGGGPGDDD